MHRLAAILVPLMIALTGCIATTGQPTVGPSPSPSRSAPTEEAVAQFRTVVARVEPVAERQCREQLPRANCDFRIVVDDRDAREPNAFQTVDRSGRPVLGFNLPLIANVRNADELAFVMAHEAAHHIAGHIPRQRQNAMAGAVLLGGLAAMTGAGSQGVEVATDLGATVGARSYSKEFELEADALGTVITRRAGYDPVRGAQFFTQIRDPGDRFLGTHPPNAQRMETVRRVNDRL